VVIKGILILYVSVLPIEISIEVYEVLSQAEGLCEVQFVTSFYE